MMAIDDRMEYCPLAGRGTIIQRIGLNIKTLRIEITELRYYGEV